MGVDLNHPTFKDMMNDVVAAGSCCECGGCVLVCPHNVIEYVEGKPKQTAKPAASFDYCGISEGIGCDVCASVCPRLWPREAHLQDALFRRERPYEGIFGVYRRVVAARTRDERVLARCQDGGVVTTLLARALRQGKIDGAVVSALDGEKPCSPIPKVVTKEEEALASAGSWYTYCPNNLALEDAERMGLTRVGFVGVPCQVTPLRKMELIDEGFLHTPKKKEQHIDRQRRFLRGYRERVAFTVGLLCSEVFTYEGLMVGKIQEEMGIPLTEVQKFNVKGKVLIYKKSGEVVDLNLKEAQQYARPECHHCGDFSGELADISCGGVGSMGWTITLLRTPLGEQLFDEMVEEGLLEVRPMEEFKRSWKVLLRLSEKQRKRVPIRPGKSGTQPDLPQYASAA
ncbi:MAG: Coenzyme F420 hydrogenase/dehydrogenase, beta subunit C-terminal domain [Nitrospinota bacterium]